jgi:hypothetical protein
MYDERRRKNAIVAVSFSILVTCIGAILILQMAFKVKTINIKAKPPVSEGNEESIPGN